MRKRVVIENVTEAVLELLIAVVGDRQQAVFDAERVSEVDTRLVATDLRRPAVEVATVEKLNPLAVVDAALAEGAGRCQQRGEAAYARTLDAWSAQNFSPSS